jgi:hypothetical protein
VAKYVEKRWVVDKEEEEDGQEEEGEEGLELLEDLGAELHDACKKNKSSCEGVLLLLASGADVNWVSEEDYGRTPLIAAVMQVMVVA